MHLWKKGVVPSLNFITLLINYIEKTSSKLYFLLKRKIINIISILKKHSFYNTLMHTLSCLWIELEIYIFNFCWIFQVIIHTKIRLEEFKIIGISYILSLFGKFYREI